MRHFRPRRLDTASLRRTLIGMTIVASVLVPLSFLTPVASAAPTETSALTLTDVSGTRIARNGTPGVVHAQVNNTGTAAAADVRVRYRLPSGLQLAPALSTAGCTVAGSIVTCALGTLAAGTSRSIDLAVREPLATAVLGSRVGYFFEPTSDAYDPSSGEIRLSTWYHDAGAEGTDLALCWPIDNPTPNMDVAGGACDGANDAAALEPDEVAVLDAFPEPLAESLVRSWQFDTEITPRQSGSYRACGLAIDDGGYLAVAPVGTPLTPADIRLNVPSFSSATGDPFDLVAGQRYRVLMRITNRGGPGVDNGANGGALAGWDAYGIVPADETCDLGAAGVFGTADSAWVKRSVADVVVVGSSDLTVLGAVESAPVDGVRSATVRVGNTGGDTTAARLSFELPAGSRLTTAPTGCDRVLTGPPPTCEVDAISPTTTAGPGLVVSVGFSGDSPGVGWNLTAVSTVDADLADNRGSLASPAG